MSEQHEKGNDILDADALASMGHSDAEVSWLLSHSVRGTADRPYLLPEEYERLIAGMGGSR